MSQANLSTDTPNNDPLQVPYAMSFEGLVLTRLATLQTTLQLEIKAVKDGLDDVRDALQSNSKDIKDIQISTALLPVKVTELETKVESFQTSRNLFRGGYKIAAAVAGITAMMITSLYHLLGVGRFISTLSASPATHIKP